MSDDMYNLLYRLLRAVILWSVGVVMAIATIIVPFWLCGSDPFSLRMTILTSGVISFWLGLTGLVALEVRREKA